MAHLFDRHEIRHFRYSFIRQEAAQQHVRIREVELLLARVFESRSDLEPTAVLEIKLSGENCRGIKARKRDEVDRTGLSLPMRPYVNRQ